MYFVLQGIDWFLHSKNTTHYQFLFNNNNYSVFQSENKYHVYDVAFKINLKIEKGIQKQCILC